VLLLSAGVAGRVIFGRHDPINFLWTTPYSTKNVEVRSENAQPAIGCRWTASSCNESVFCLPRFQLQYDLPL